MVVVLGGWMNKSRGRRSCMDGGSHAGWRWRLRNGFS